MHGLVILVVTSVIGPEEPVALVNGRVLCRGDLEDVMRSEVPAVRRTLRTVAGRREFVRRQADLELLADEAERQGLLEDPEVRRILRHVLARRLIDKQAGLRTPSEDDLRRAFVARRAEFTRPEERRVATIVLSTRRSSTPGLAERLRQDALAHRTDGGYFRRLVEKYSGDASSRARGGVTPYFSRDAKELAEPVRAAAFSMGEVGDVEVVNAAGAVYVLRLIGRRGPLDPTFEQVRERLRKSLQRSRRQGAERQLLEALRSRATIEIRDAALRRLQLH